LNDSKYVGISLYNVVLLSTTTAVVGYFLQDQHERSYILTSIFILLCVTITLCLVFVPKVREVAKDPRSTAKPQRAVLSNVANKLPQDNGEDRKILTNNHQQWIFRLKQLTNQNDILKSAAVKVCILYLSHSTSFYFLSILV
jgi:Na+/melibiose symporter-like transporter